MPVPHTFTSNQQPANKVVQMHNGRLAFLPAYTEADAWQSAVFTIELAGRHYQIDHYVKVLPNKEAWQDLLAALNQ
ncbi:MAG: hypothetical protein D3925_17135, partial [Candidatus Electrothrix sp. AR5]|nr:hypothetical protein [Candidatus Electrothrix sp. AR5]